MPTVNRIDEGREGGLFDFLMYQPYGKGPVLTDDEAQFLYNLWKTSKPGERKFVPASKGAIIALKAKGYLSGATEVELTDRGRKVIVEMVTREPSVLEKSSDPPPYSKIKATAKRRARQTFVEKKASAETASFNLRSQRQAMLKEAGVWDFMATPFRDWWAGAKEKTEDWFTESKANFGEARELWKAVQRAKNIANSNLQANYQQALRGGVQGATLQQSVTPIIQAIDNFRNTVGRVVPIPPNPPMPAPDEVVDAEAFAHFYNVLSKVVEKISWESVVQYEKNKGHAAAAPLGLPKGPEDQSFENEFRRLMDAINRKSPPGPTGAVAPIIPPANIDSILGNYGGKKLVDAMTELSMKARGIDYVDNMASDIIMFIMRSLNPMFQAHRANLARGGRASAYELRDWDATIKEMENDLARNVKQVMQKKFTRMFGGQAPQEGRGRGREMAV